MQNRVYPGSAGQGLRQMDILGRFSAFVYKGDNLNGFLFAFLHPKPKVPSEKGSTFKGNNTSQFFAFKEDPFLEALQTIMIKLLPLKAY